MTALHSYKNTTLTVKKETLKENSEQNKTIFYHGKQHVPERLLSFIEIELKWYRINKNLQK